MSETEQVVFMVTDKPIISLKHEQLHKLNMDIFGDLPTNEYNDLKQDIKTRGIQDPLHVVKQTGGYIVVSGHQRLRVAQELGIDLPCIVRTDLNEEWQVEEQLIKDNLLRRHLNDYQKVNAGERLEIIERIKNKDIKLKSVDLQPRDDTGHFKTLPSVEIMPPTAEISTEHTQLDSECESCDNEYPALECDSCVYNAKTTMTSQREQEIMGIMSMRTPNDYEKTILAENTEHTEKEKAKTAPKTRDIVASQIGMSGRQYDNAKKVMHEAPEPIRQKWRSGEITTGTAIREMKKEENIKNNVPHVSYNTRNFEWYSPEEYITSAKKLMGVIDIDPASSETANQVVQAIQYYTKEQNGLKYAWHGNVWMNPPYSSELIGKFIDKLCNEFDQGNIEQACVLVNNATETKWFQKLIKYSSMVLFPSGRVKFWHPRKNSAPLQGQALLYLGKNTDLFYDNFNHFGVVCHVIQ